MYNPDTRVRQVMRPGVISLSVDSSLETAVRTFEDHRISGCPVIDEVGKLVGVLSASDIANSSRMEDGKLGGGSGEYYLADRFRDESEPEDFDLGGYNADMDRSIEVRDIMTPRVHSIDPDQTVESACQMMIEQRVHRLLVTEEDALVGILSTFDIVRAVAGAPELA